MHFVRRYQGQLGHDGEQPAGRVARVLVVRPDQAGPGTSGGHQANGAVISAGTFWAESRSRGGGTTDNPGRASAFRDADRPRPPAVRRRSKSAKCAVPGVTVRRRLKSVSHFHQADDLGTGGAAVTLRVNAGHDPEYPLRSAGSAVGYYLQDGKEPPGQWAGKGAEALGPHRAGGPRGVPEPVRHADHADGGEAVHRPAAPVRDRARRERQRRRRRGGGRWPGAVHDTGRGTAHPGQGAGVDRGGRAVLRPDVLGHQVGRACCRPAMPPPR